jgi:hypothetical protein
VLTGWSPASGDGRSRAALHVARLGAGGELIAAGAVQLNLDSRAAQPLRELLESGSLPRRRAGRVRVPSGVAVEVDFHGAPGGALRDAVLRRVDLAHVVCGEREQLDGGVRDGGVVAAAIVGELAGRTQEIGTGRDPPTGRPGSSGARRATADGAARQTMRVSEQIQRRARDQREAAKRREANARERAERNQGRGDELLARIHEDNADLQANVAEAAERRRLADVEREGERLGEPAEDTLDA